MSILMYILVFLVGTLTGLLAGMSIYGAFKRTTKPRQMATPISSPSDDANSAIAATPRSWEQVIRTSRLKPFDDPSGLPDVPSYEDAQREVCAMVLRYHQNEVLPSSSQKAVYRSVLLEDGCRFVGRFVNGVRNGPGIKTYPNGATYEGFWVNGERHGSGVKTHADGTEKHVAYKSVQLWNQACDYAINDVLTQAKTAAQEEE